MDIEVIVVEDMGNSKGRGGTKQVIARFRANRPLEMLETIRIHGVGDTYITAVRDQFSRTEWRQEVAVRLLPRHRA